MPTKMQLPKGHGPSVSHGGKEYKADARGIVAVHDSAVDDLKGHGLTVVDDDSGKTTTAEAPDPKMMNKAALLEYCEANDLTAPDGAKVEELRALVQADLDAKAE